MFYKKLSLGICAAAMGVASGTATAAPDFKFGGYAKLDAFYTDYKDNDGEQNIFLDPRTVPLENSAAAADRSSEFDTTARTSRFNFKVSETFDGIGTVMGFIEVDFSSSGGGSLGSEVATNAYTPALRHAFVKWTQGSSSLLTGQTWSTFMNTGVYPETLDWVGPTAGIVFIRQNQIRYSKKLADGASFDIALENPASTFDSASVASDADDESVPDIIARYNGKTGSVTYSVAGILRQVVHDNGVIDDSVAGFGVSASAKIALSGKNNLKFMINTGQLGRYQAVAGFNDGVILANGDIDETTATGGFIGYQHWLSDKTRMNFLYAASKGDLADTADRGTNESIYNWSVNWLTSPVPKLTYGVEFIQAGRETNDGREGEATRIQFSTKYAF